MKPSLAVFLHSHTYDRIYQATALLATASSMGWSCHLFLFYGALASFVSGTWDEVDLGAAGNNPPSWHADLQAGFESSNLPSPSELLHKAAGDAGGVKVFACSGSCRVLGYQPDEIRERVDGIVGLHTMMQIAEKTTHVIYL